MNTPKPKPPPLPPHARRASAGSGTRPKATGVLRLLPKRYDLFFDEVLVFESGFVLVAREGAPVFRYRSLEEMLEQTGLGSHDFVAAAD